LVKRSLSLSRIVINSEKEIPLRINLKLLFLVLLGINLKLLLLVLYRVKAYLLRVKVRLLFLVLY
jgi:hypothetical protein